MHKSLDKRHYLLRLFAGEGDFAADAVAAADGKAAIRVRSLIGCSPALALMDKNGTATVSSLLSRAAARVGGSACTACGGGSGCGTGRRAGSGLVFGLGPGFLRGCGFRLPVRAASQY